MTTNHVDVSMHHQSEEERLANDSGKSDSRIVPQKRIDQVRETKLSNVSEGKATKLSREKDRTRSLHSDGKDVIKRLDRISERAKSQREEAFSNVFTLLDVDLLRQAFRKLERGKASGIDGQTVEEYEANLESNLKDWQRDFIARAIVLTRVFARKFQKGMGRHAHGHSVHRG